MSFPAPTATTTQEVVTAIVKVIAADEKETKLDIDALKPCHGQFDLTYASSICVSGWDQVRTDSFGLAGDLSESVDPSSTNFIGKPPAKLAALMKSTLTVGNSIIRDTISQERTCVGATSPGACHTASLKVDADFSAMLSEIARFAPYLR